MFMIKIFKNGINKKNTIKHDVNPSVKLINGIIVLIKSLTENG